MFNRPMIELCFSSANFRFGKHPSDFIKSLRADFPFKFRCQISNKVKQNIKNAKKNPEQKLISRSSAHFLIGGSIALGGKVVLRNIFVNCEANSGSILSPHDRLEGVPSTHAVEDPPFDWSQFWQLLKPQLINFIAAVLSALIVALSNIQIPLLLGEVVNVVAKYTQGNANEGSRFLDDILKPCMKIFQVYVVQSMFTFIYIAFLTRMGERMASDLRMQLFDSLLKQDIAFYDKHKAGELVNRLTADVQDFKSSFKMCISQGMRSVTQIIGCGISMYEISPQMAGWTAVLVPVIIGLFSRELEKSTHLNELLGMGIGIFQAGTNLFLNGVVLGTLYIGGNMLSTGVLKPGDLMSFLVCAQTIQKSLGQLSILWGTYVRGMSAGARVFEQSIPEPKLNFYNTSYKEHDE
ncbi:ATP-binding cassette sub-family B member 8, mitochondrial [Armadillidium nasatum]|uniref:ATP-binding cassette sub-family B member 8, mitochondrial n=1 Tax=Armadillidium nasatum TaxID=96803 RepID=A0A5N5T7R5_9CRUS|nr:ATP-binding cassette sub-family B member 8, mitochondrial [Armadillidium nasatum]